MFDRIIGYLSKTSNRSRKIAGNIVVSFFAKGVSILCSLLVVPLTIKYLNSTLYGIWLTISGIIAWIGFFDLGFGNGFRNRFAEAKAQGDIQKARSYLSTTYMAMTILMAVILSFCLLLNTFIDWPLLLHINDIYSNELRITFAILCVFFCLNLVFSIFSTLATANQNPALSSIINAIGQVIAVIVIWILINNTEGSLVNLSLYYSGIPCIVMLVFSILAFSFSPYKVYSPSLRLIKVSYIKDLMSLGLKFFVICVSLVLVFQLTNIILLRECGPESVTEYNVAYKYFHVLYSVVIIIITPLWSAFTDAYKQHDFAWMQNTMHSMNKLQLIVALICMIMLVLSPYVYDIWLDGEVKVPFVLSAVMMLFMLSCIISNIYMYMINGIGTISLQLIVYVVMAVMAWPVITLSARYLGVVGVLIFPTLVYCIQAIVAKVQLNKILCGRAKGIWCR